MRFNKLTGFMISAYGTIDPRSLALGRMALASVLLLDLIARAANLTTFYANGGLLPNHTVLWRPSCDHVFSFFFMASQPAEVAVLFMLCAFAYLMLLLGYKTKLAQVLSWLCVLGLHGRTIFLQNGGDVVLVTLALWTAFLPSGRCWSVDSLRFVFAGRSDGRPSANSPVTSLAVTALLIQLSVIYLFNAVQKDGSTWQQGSVVHYVLHQDRIVTWLGVVVREHMTPTLSRVLTWTALGIEWLLPLTLLWPFRQGFTRSAAVTLVLILHLGFALLINLGIFVPVMIAFALHFVPSEFWDRIGRSTAVHRLRNHALLALSKGLLKRPALLQLLRREKAPTRATAEILQLLREYVVALLMIVAAGQLFSDNHFLRHRISWQQPAVVRVVVEYLQLFEGWSMFAPEAPAQDFNVVVDAVTRDGRHVDPFNEAASPGQPNPRFGSPQRLQQNWLFCDYVVGIAHRGSYHQAFIEWVQRYEQRTGNPRDHIVSFDAYVVTDDSPPLGENLPRNVRKEVFVHWPATTTDKGRPVAAAL